MRAKGKKIVLSVLGIAALAVLTFYFQKKTTDYKKVLNDKEALLVLDYGSGNERWFKGQVASGMTVRDALETASLAGGFAFQANAHLAALNGRANGEGGKWVCYVNSREVKEGLDKKEILPQDKIVCKYR